IEQYLKMKKTTCSIVICIVQLIIAATCFLACKTPSSERTARLQALDSTKFALQGSGGSGAQGAVDAVKGVGGLNPAESDRLRSGGDLPNERPHPPPPSGGGMM